MTHTDFDVISRQSATFFPAILTVVAVALSVAYVGSSYLLADCDESLCRRTVAFFDFGRESNLPTWFSVACWMLAAILCVSAASSPSAARLRLRGFWIGLAALSLFLSMDEGAMFHERFGTEIGGALWDGGLGLYSWQTYGAVLLLIVAVAFFPFLRRLPKGTRRRLFLAVGLFVSGALGAESVEALFLRENAPYEGAAIRAIPNIHGIQFLVEELLEMFGIIVWIHTILHFIGLEAEHGDVRSTI